MKRYQETSPQQFHATREYFLTTSWSLPPLSAVDMGLSTRGATLAALSAESVLYGMFGLTQFAVSYASRLKLTIE